MNGTSLVLPSLNIDKVSEHARFLILSLPNNEMLQKSPFAIHKAIQGISGEPKSVKKLRSGDLLIETSSALQTKSLLLTKTFLDCPLIVNLHRSLNSCRGVISETDLLCASGAEILDGLSDQGVTEVRRIKIKKETSLFPTKHLILTFNSPNLPSKIKAGYLNCKLRPYIPNPLRCFKCQRFGHSQNSCHGQLTCSRCAAVGHSSTDCTLEPKCINCSQIHTADSKLCPKWKTEKEIQTIKTNKNISYFEARKLIAPQFSQTYAQVAKPSIATSTTQTDENITKSTTQVNLLPSASSIKPTTQTESRLPEPISSAAAPDNSLNTSASSLSTETRLLKTSNKFAALSTEIQSLVPQVHLLPSTSTVATVSEPPPPNPTSNDTPSITNTHQMKTMFTPLSAETCPAVETATSITDTFPFTSQDAKQTLRSRKKRRPKRSITSKIDTQLTPHKPKKSIPLQDTSDEDMLIYDVAEEVESPQKLTPVNEIEKFSDEWWQAEGWKREEYSRTLTPTRNRKSRIKNEPKNKKRKYCDAKDSEGISVVNSKKTEKLKCTAESIDESVFASVEKKALTNDEMYFPRNKKKSKLNSITGNTLFSEKTENTPFNDKNNDFSPLSVVSLQGEMLKKKKDKFDVNNSSEGDQIHKKRKKTKHQDENDKSDTMNTMGKILDQRASVKSPQKKWKGEKENTDNGKTMENRETLNDIQNSDDISVTENDFDQKSKPKNDTKFKKKRFLIEPETPERLARTLFVGNLPVIVSRQMLEKLFVPFGSVESCRLRGSVPTKSSIPKKVADIKMKFHDTQRSRIGYVVFKDENAAAQAMSLNGMLVGDHHIVVNKVSQVGEKTLYDKKRSIFIGNLPFNTDEDMIWNTFAECGHIEAVRVIRDRETGTGKGFGYVLFRKIKSKENALKLEDVKIADRIIRIKEVIGDPGKPKLTNQWCAVKRKAMKIKKQDSCKKSLKKIMKKEKLNYQKKKCAEMFKNFSI
ncbi:RNA-binding protein 34 [Trichonephila clavipes]|nr:RNA-binding protein 34 [Trichonephila clavipes]